MICGCLDQVTKLGVFLLDRKHASYDSIVPSKQIVVSEWTGPFVRFHAGFEEYVSQDSVARPIVVGCISQILDGTA